MTTNNIHSDEHILATFQTIDRIHYHRGVLWHALFSIIFAVIAGFVVLFSPTQLIMYLSFAAVFIATTIIVWIDRHPRMIEIKITEGGVFRGEKFYSWEKIKDHWFVQNNDYGINSWYLGFHEDFHHSAYHVRIELIEVHPDEVRDVVNPIMEETVARPEPSHETRRRFFKL